MIAWNNLSCMNWLTKWLPKWLFLHPKLVHVLMEFLQLHKWCTWPSLLGSIHQIYCSLISVNIFTEGELVSKDKGLKIGQMCNGGRNNPCIFVSVKSDATHQALFLISIETSYFCACKSPWSPQLNKIKYLRTVPNQKNPQTTPWEEPGSTTDQIFMITWSALGYKSTVSMSESSLKKVWVLSINVLGSVNL